MIITSFSQEGYHTYGKRFIESFLKHWKDESLTVYYEHGIPTSRPTDDRITYIDLYQFDDFKAFERMLDASDPLYRGIQRGKNPDQHIYNFRFDAMRFYRKVYCMHHATMHGLHEVDKDASKVDKLVAWIDADVYTHSDVPRNFLEKLTGDDIYISYLHREWLYPESGFVLFNTQNEAHITFMSLFLGSYFNGAFKLLGEWHDCYVIDYLIRMLGVNRANLNPNEKSDHPFNESVLGKYMDHMKGPDRKKQGKSHAHELQRTA